jgi:uncharacterized protein YcfL
MVGCSSNTAGLRVDGQSQQVLYGDTKLAKRIAIDDISSVRLDNRVRAVVRITNTQTSDTELQYRFYWYDNNGIEVNARPSAWRQLLLRGEESRSLSEVSVHPEGSEFRIQLREAD